MISTAGKYFDGISSKPQEIELKLDELNDQLRFDTSSCQINYAIGDISFEHIGSSLEIRNKIHSRVLIIVNNDDFTAAFISFLKRKGHISLYQRIIRLGFKTHLLIATVILTFIIAGYVLIIPWVGEKAVLLIPVSYDISMGDTFYDQFIINNEIDSTKTEALNSFSRHLQLNNTHKIHFTVIKSSTVNAFSLPDGNIIVFTGLIDLMKNYDELAGLIAHEVSHINNRHSMKMLCRNLSGYLFISAVLSDVNGIMAIIGDNVHNLQTLSYSRQFERQADEQGTNLMIMNGINPTGMVELFTRLHSSEKVVVPAFMSSHPITTDRIVDIKRLIIRTPHHHTFNPNLDKLFRKVKY